MFPYKGIAGEEKTAPPARDAAKLVEILGSRDYTVREDATEKLLSLGEAARKVLEAALKSKDPEIAWRAEAILERLGVPGMTMQDSVRAVLIAFSRQGGRDREGKAYKDLRTLGKGALRVMPRMLKEFNRNHAIRQFIYKYLATDGNRQTVAEIIRLLVDPAFPLNYQLCRTAFRINRNEAVKHIKKTLSGGSVPELQRALALAHNQFDEEFVEAAAAHIEHKNTAVRCAVFRLIERSRKIARYSKRILAAIDDPNPQIRRVALSILSRAKDPAAIPRLVELVKNTKADMSSRYHALYALIGYDDERVADAFKAVLTSKEPGDQYLKSLALNLLPQLKAEWAAGIARSFLDSRDIQIRRAAVSAVGRMKDKESVDKVKELLSDNDRLVRVTAIEVLPELMDNTAAVVEAVRTFLDNDKSHYAKRAVRVLGRLKCAEAVDLLIEILGREYNVAREAQHQLQAITRRFHGSVSPSNHEANKALIAKWKKWWAANKKSFRFK
jgi:HEAT repeat protein